MPRLSPAELSARATGMGSTCIVEANGLSPWSGAGPMRLYCEKLGIAAPDDAEEDSEASEWLEWGHVQEPIIASWYEHERGDKLQLGGPVYSSEVPEFWATLDRKVIGQPRIVEVKNVGSPRLYSHWDASSTDGVPRYVRAQVTMAMRFASIPECDVVASIGGRPPHVWRVFYDAELGDLLMSGAVAFWQMVKARKHPPLDHTSASKAYLHSKYPSNADRIIDDCDEIEHQLAMARLEASIAETRAAKEKQRIDALLMQRIGPRAGIKGSGWSMTWKVGADGKRRQRFTVKGVPGDE